MAMSILLASLLLDPSPVLIQQGAATETMRYRGIERLLAKFEADAAREAMILANTSPAARPVLGRDPED